MLHNKKIMNEVEGWEMDKEIEELKAAIANRLWEQHESTVIAGDLAQHLNSMGYVRSVPDEERRERIEQIIGEVFVQAHNEVSITASDDLFFRESAIRDLALCEKHTIPEWAEIILRLQPTLPKGDTELVLFIHNYIKGNGTLPDAKDMKGWSQVVEALDEYVRQIEST